MVTVEAGKALVLPRPLVDPGLAGDAIDYAQGTARRLPLPGHPTSEMTMFKPLSPIVLLATAICLSGASCHDQSSTDPANTQNPATLDGGNNRSGSEIVPRQQIQPRMHRM
ncbi:hypothetical protein [Pseudomonas sp. RA_35y_Pfl2_P32]|uniref:hypothetical protein n=1 Tax=Pseudomonas sp. RA_35y_Pfl2_P32 TaxID=3088705 RepID=UPI0030D8BB6B